MSNLKTTCGLSYGNQRAMILRGSAACKNLYNGFAVSNFHFSHFIRFSFTGSRRMGEVFVSKTKRMFERIPGTCGLCRKV